MTAELPRFSWKLTACKIIIGSMAALVAVLAGERACGGRSNLFDACSSGLGYFLPLELFEVSVTLLAISLLLSAFRDVFANLGRFTLVGRGVESVADMANDD